MPCLSGKFLYMRVCCPLVGIITILQRIFLEKHGSWLRASSEVTTFLLEHPSPSPNPWYLRLVSCFGGWKSQHIWSVGYEWPELGLPSSPLAILEVWPLTSSISITWVLEM